MKKLILFLLLLTFCSVQVADADQGTWMKYKVSGIASHWNNEYFIPGGPGTECNPGWYCPNPVTPEFQWSEDNLTVYLMHITHPSHPNLTVYLFYRNLAYLGYYIVGSGGNFILQNCNEKIFLMPNPPDPGYHLPFDFRYVDKNFCCEPTYGGGPVTWRFQRQAGPFTYTIGEPENGAHSRDIPRFTCWGDPSDHCCVRGVEFSTPSSFGFSYSKRKITLNVNGYLRSHWLIIPHHPTYDLVPYVGAYGAGNAEGGAYCVQLHDFQTGNCELWQVNTCGSLRDIYYVTGSGASPFYQYPGY